MKTTNLVFGIAISSLLIGFTSCKKTDATSKDEIATTIELSTDQAIADNLTEDANDVFMEAAADKGLTGMRPLTPYQTAGILSCASVTVKPLIGFPKTLIIDFGTGCTSANGIARSGIINITLSDSVRKPGSNAVLTFDNYYVNGYKKEGKITWINTSTATVKGWQRGVENGKITSPTGKYWLHSGITNVVQTVGYSTTFNLIDDEFSITGNHTVTNDIGASRTSLIVEPLIKKTICENISQGSIKLQGPNHYAMIDFGAGSCDRLATVSIDGGTGITILLR